VPGSGADGAASEDGPGQKNPDWSEGPWGRAAEAVRTEVPQRARPPAQNGESDEGSGEHEGRGQTARRETAPKGKAPSEIPALKPYWGKPAVRNFREGNGNVGIIRSPLRAIALPDKSSALVTAGWTTGMRPRRPSFRARRFFSERTERHKLRWGCGRLLPTPCGSTPGLCPCRPASRRSGQSCIG
jgi:hypothetical protein